MAKPTDPLTAHVKANRAKQPRRKRPPKPEPDWSRRGLDLLKAMHSGSEVTADDMVLRLGPAPQTNAPGSLFQQAARDGILTDTGNTVVSEKRAARGRRIRVWRRI